MVTLNRGKKTALIAITLLAVIMVPTVYLTATYVDPLSRRYYINPDSAIHISPNGDITTPTSDISTPNIQRSEDTYTLTGNITNWLIIEKSNLVFKGNGFWVGGLNGLSLQNVCNVTVEDVNVKASFSYLQLQHTQNCTLLRTQSLFNIHLYDSSGNTFSKCKGSISMDYSSNNTAVNCSIGSFELYKSNFNSVLYSNFSYSGRNLSFEDSSNNLVFGSRFVGMAWWISMGRGSCGNVIVGNEIRMEPRYYADMLTANNHVYHNNFLNFAWNQTASMPVNVWSSDGKGNYWADYTGTDINGDGIGDKPYVIDATNHDNYPLMAPVNIATETIPTINR